jgi:hypothetical protein
MALAGRQIHKFLVGFLDIGEGIADAQDPFRILDGNGAIGNLSRAGEKEKAEQGSKQCLFHHVLLFVFKVIGFCLLPFKFSKNYSFRIVTCHKSVLSPNRTPTQVADAKQKNTA